MALQKSVQIKNRKARFEYEILETFTSGIVLRGTEIKAIREGKASIAESFCEFSNGELFAINMTIQEYSHASHFTHNPKTERKLLLNRKELKKLEKEVKNSGLTIVPLLLFTNEKGLAKLEIALCRGKKQYDKREVMKERDTKRDLSRIKKAFNN
ncbi:MAG: SsrA-binding protein SmpB [Flavobacteriaceae bacterium]|nr:SsrA-binding protein SmpB [Flavobacteriaceae bacterium]